MTGPKTSTQRDNLVGSLWMIGAMAGFAIEDALIKGASSAVPIGQVLVLFGLGGSVLFAVLALARKEPLMTPDVVSPAMRVRFGFELVGRLFYGLALALTPLSVATVILQATPLVVVAGAALVFGERVGWRRWSAIALGMIGVLLIVQPSADGVSLLSVLAVIGMLGFAGRDLASRAAPKALSANVLGFYGFLAIIVAGAAFSVWKGDPFVIPDVLSLVCLAGAVVAGVLAYTSLMNAMRTGEVSAVTPFRYTRLIFGLGLGVLVFGETVSPTMLLGIALIVVSGLFILWRGQARQPQL